MFRQRPLGKLLLFFFFVLLSYSFAIAQTTFPANDVADPRNNVFAFTNATIVKDGNTTLTNATLVIREGKIIFAGNNGQVPKNAVIIDCRGKYIYPSFIDMYSDYGIPVAERSRTGFDFRAPTQMNSNTKGAYNWNQAIKPETDASKIFAV
ncbi:MAG TPA: hypothetical protein VKR53_19810, partial [Puia sp.]|nr:hypothetical protein [Puia sp.]